MHGQAASGPRGPRDAEEMRPASSTRTRLLTMTGIGRPADPSVSVCDVGDAARRRAAGVVDAPREEGRPRGENAVATAGGWREVPRHGRATRDAAIRARAMRMSAGGGGKDVRHEA